MCHRPPPALPAPPARGRRGRRAHRRDHRDRRRPRPPARRRHARSGTARPRAGRTRSTATDGSAAPAPSPRAPDSLAQAMRLRGPIPERIRELRRGRLRAARKRAVAAGPPRAPGHVGHGAAGRRRARAAASAAVPGSAAPSSATSPPRRSAARCHSGRPASAARAKSAWIAASWPPRTTSAASIVIASSRAGVCALACSNRSSVADSLPRSPLSVGVHGNRIAAMCARGTPPRRVSRAPAANVPTDAAN